MLSGCFKSVESLSLHYRPYMFFIGVHVCSRLFMFVHVCCTGCRWIVMQSEIFVAVCNLYQCWRGIYFCNHLSFAKVFLSLSHDEHLSGKGGRSRRRRCSSWLVFSSSAPWWNCWSDTFHFGQRLFEGRSSSSLRRSRGWHGLCALSENLTA